jgi:hypothetical protein
MALVIALVISLVIAMLLVAFFVRFIGLLLFVSRSGRGRFFWPEPGWR